MKNSTFTYGDDNVVVLRHGLQHPNKEAYASGFTVYQTDSEGHPHSFYMGGRETIKAFSAFLTEHVGLPAVDWDALAKEVERRLFSDGDEPSTAYLAAYQDTFALIREFYESNQLPRLTNK